jgi:hypothetical protein
MVPQSRPTNLPKSGFIWAPIIFVVTGVIGIMMIVLSLGTIANTIGGFKSVDSGQSIEVKLSKGEYFVFAAGPTSTVISGVSVGITDPRGEEVLPKENSASYSAEVDGTRYESIGSFDVTTTGTYTVQAQGPAGSSASLGQIPAAKAFGLLAGGIAVGSLGFVLALVVLITTIVRRNRAKRNFVGPVTWSAPPPATVTILPAAPPPSSSTVTLIPPPSPSPSPSSPPAPPSSTRPTVPTPASAPPPPPPPDPVEG